MGKQIHNFNIEEIHEWLFYADKTVEQIAKEIYGCHPSTLNNYLIKNKKSVIKGLSGFLISKI
jgi:hypothetical protein